LAALEPALTCLIVRLGTQVNALFQQAPVAAPGTGSAHQRTATMTKRVVHAFHGRGAAVELFANPVLCQREKKDA
jgi:hypothetical protein